MRSAEYEMVCSSPLPVPVVVVVVGGVAVDAGAPAPLPLPPSPAPPVKPPAAALSRELVLDEAEVDILASLTPPPASCPPWVGNMGEIGVVERMVRRVP